VIQTAWPAAPGRLAGQTAFTASDTWTLRPPGPPRASPAHVETSKWPAHVIPRPLDRSGRCG